VNNNTKLEPIELQRKIELSKIEQVNKQPMPMLELMVDYIPVDFSAKPEYDAFYYQRLMLPKKLNLNEKVNIIGAEKQEITKSQLRVDLIRQIKTNYFNLYYYDKLIAFNQEYQKIMSNLVKSLEASYASGMGNQSQILKMNNELQLMTYEQIEMEQMKKVVINNLRVLSNLNLPDDFKPKDINVILNKNLDLDTTKLINLMLSNNPEFKMIDNMLKQARVEKNIAELEKVPDITLGGGVRYMANVPMTNLAFSVGIDLPFMPWNSKRISAMLEEKKLMEQQANSQQVSSLNYMKNELQSMVIMLNTLKEKKNYLNEVLIPQTEQTFNSSLASYSSSTSEFMNLLDSYRRLREADEKLVKEETEYLKQLSELEFLLGTQITM
jgi:outer membrane protein TolC